jgi:2-keto-4-pentenoate hydratase/2-oxohepta-3-ene-1,7-dioic acid hydratase in catechol pathway
MMRRAVVVVLVVMMFAPTRAQRPLISTSPETPFKLATFQAEGKTRLGLVLGTRILDLEVAHAAVVQELGLRGTPAIPREMRTLIEDYERLAPHLYRIANRFKEASADNPLFAFRVDRVAILAPVKYPSNLLAIAANYKLHAGEMFPPGTPQQKAALEADQDKEDPVFFAKSPRSCIIDPDEPYIMPPGRNIDWEGELAIVIGKTALNVAAARAHDYVFGYSIMYDVSDRGGQGRPLTGMFPGPNWFSGKSRDKSAPFGPFIVPKEFAPNPPHFRIVTKVNGEVKQDGNTANWIWDEAHMIRYLTSILTLYPGDVISSGTPDGVGAGRKPPEFLKPGDVVTIDIDGIGTLRTPMKAAAAGSAQ